MTQEEINFAKIILPEDGLHLATIGGSCLEVFAKAVTSPAQSLQCSSSSSSSPMTMTQDDMTCTVSITNTAKRHGTTIHCASVHVVKWPNDFIITKKSQSPLSVSLFLPLLAALYYFHPRGFPHPFCSLILALRTVGILSFVLFGSWSQGCHIRQNQNTLLLSTQNTNRGHHLKTFLRN